MEDLTQASCIYLTAIKHYNCLKYMSNFFLFIATYSFHLSFLYSIIPSYLTELAFGVNSDWYNFTVYKVDVYRFVFIQLNPPFHHLIVTLIKIVLQLTSCIFHTLRFECIFFIIVKFRNLCVFFLRSMEMYSQWEVQDHLVL